MQIFQPICPFQSEFKTAPITLFVNLPHYFLPPDRAAVKTDSRRITNEDSTLHALDRMVSFTSKKDFHSVESDHHVNSCFLLSILVGSGGGELWIPF